MRTLMALLLHVTAFGLLLWRQVQIVFPQYGITQHAFWVQLQQAVQGSFATAPTQLLLLLLIMAPTWAVFVTRPLPWFGRLVYAAVWAWWLLMLAFALAYVSLSPLPAWFVYAAVMLALGLVGMIYRTFLRDDLRTAVDEHTEHPPAV